MPKVITLEKAADGTYEIPKNHIVEEKPQEKHIDYTVSFEKTVVTPTMRRKDRRRTHEFIVKNGDNISQFLDGVNKTIKTAMLLKRLMR